MPLFSRWGVDGKAHGAGVVEPLALPTGLARPQGAALALVHEGGWARLGPHHGQDFFGRDDFDASGQGSGWDLGCVSSRRSPLAPGALSGLGILIDGAFIAITPDRY
jgi:hypothetical protein